MNTNDQDFSRHLVLYSGGADSTHFISDQPTARHLIHYAGLNEQQTKIAAVNANLLNRHLTIVAPDLASPRDGETNQIHALHDTQMAIDAGIRALNFGMRGVVMCFNADDIAIDFDSVKKILRRVDPKFELLTPLRETSAKKIRASLKASKLGLKYVSCMYSTNCGFCAKCLRKF